MRAVSFLPFALLASASFAQTVAVKVASASGQANKPAKAVVELSIPKGYHIYGPVAKGSIATKIVWSGAKGVTIAPQYPTPHDFDAFGEKVKVYEGKVSIPVVVTFPKGTKGKQTLSFKVTSQACNDRTCLQPTTQTVTGSVVLK